LATLAEKFSYRQYRRRSFPIGYTDREVLSLTMLAEKFSYRQYRWRSSPIDNAGGEVLLLDYSQMKSTAMSASLLM